MAHVRKCRWKLSSNLELSKSMTFTKARSMTCVYRYARRAAMVRNQLRQNAGSGAAQERDSLDAAW